MRPLVPLLTFLFWVAGPLWAQAPPALVRQGQRLHLKELPALLTHPEVKESLASGLTTTFVWEVVMRDSRGVKVEGHGVIEIRYELWDEVYLVRWVDLRNRLERESLPAGERLTEWWRNLELVMADAAGLAAAEPLQARLSLSVLPFSSEEQRDAQRWFTRSLETKGGEAGSSDLQLADVLNVVIATSIGRESSLTFDWRLTVPVGASR